jgi:hypothetical protein
LLTPLQHLGDDHILEIDRVHRLGAGRSVGVPLVVDASASPGASRVAGLSGDADRAGKRVDDLVGRAARERVSGVVDERSASSR